MTIPTKPITHILPTSANTHNPDGGLVPPPPEAFIKGSDPKQLNVTSRAYVDWKADTECAKITQ